MPIATAVMHTNDNGRIASDAVNLSPMNGPIVTSSTNNDSTNVNRFCSTQLSGNTSLGKYCRRSIDSAPTTLIPQPSIDVAKKPHGSTPLRTYSAKWLTSRNSSENTVLSTAICSRGFSSDQKNPSAERR